MKANAKCKNSSFEPPFGDVGVTHRVHLWLDGKRIVDFLLAIIELFSLALTAAALLSEICQNRQSKGKRKEDRKLSKQTNNLYSTDMNKQIRAQ